MSLVNYGYSDDDDDDDNDNNNDNNLTLTTKIEKSNESLNDEKTVADKISSFSSLTFKNLYKPNNSRIQIKAFDDDIVMNQNGTYTESESDSEDDEDNRKRKRIKRSEKGSSLISILPKPKNTIKSITTTNNNHLIDKSSSSSNTTSSLIPSSVLQKNKKITSLSAKLQKLHNDDDDDDDDDENINSFFFNNLDSNNDNNEIKIIPNSINIDNSILLPSTSSDTNKESNVNVDKAPIYGPSKPPTTTNNEQLSYNNDPNNDITLKKFIASKFDDHSDNVKIMDINVQKHLSENNEWLKNISIEKDIVDEQLEAKAPNSLAKRKNQITFLAYQAKKRELELKNQWAQNRQTKAQTRAKYGF